MIQVESTSRIKVGLHQKFRVTKVAGRMYQGGETLTVSSISPDHDLYGFAEEWFTASFVNDIFGIYGQDVEVLYLLEPIE